MSEKIDEQMIEHVAKAMFAADNHPDAVWPEKGARDRIEYGTRDRYRRLARIAIIAIWDMPLDHGLTIMDIYRAARVRGT